LARLEARRALPLPFPAAVPEEARAADEGNGPGGPASPSDSGKLTFTTQSVNLPLLNCSW
jgi:hypothetical protein